jgi:hypothetical protein
MSTLDTSTPRKRFARWNSRDKELWLDIFESYSGILLTALADEEHEHETEEAAAEAANRCIRLAAELTDTAMQEAQYRFWIQEEVKPKTKRKTR